MEAHFFDPWRPSVATINIQRDFPTEELYGSQSAPLELAEARSRHTTLPLFHSASSTGVVQPGSSSRSAAEDGDTGNAATLSSQHVRDTVINAGGPVWALGWCPTEVSLPAAARPELLNRSTTEGSGHSRPGSSSLAAAHYLAVGCHTLQSPHNLLGRATQGPALIQIYEVAGASQCSLQATAHQTDTAAAAADGSPASHPVGTQQAQQAAVEGAQLWLPRLALGIAHSGGLTWHVQWCPDAGLADSLDSSTAGPAGLAALSGRLPRLGLLAAAFGDGSVVVWAVPHPSCLRHHAVQTGQQPLPDNQPLIASLEPVAQLSSRHLGGSMPNLLDWLSAEPYDLLLVGCWDGNVAIVKLNPTASSSTHPHAQGQQQQQQQQGQQPPKGLEVLSFFQADSVSLRAARWIPPAVCRGSIDLLHRHVFVAVGHEGALKIWDDRDQFMPLYHQTLTTTVLLNAAWTSSPFGLLVALEDATLKGMVLDTETVQRNLLVDKGFSVNWRGQGMGALWALDVHQELQLVAYGGEDGEVGVFTAAYEGDRRRRPPHTPIAGLFKDHDLLILRSVEDLQGNTAIYSGKIQERSTSIKDARFPHELEAVHRVAWHPRAVGNQALLASAGAAGLVRLQWVQKE